MSLELPCRIGPELDFPFHWRKQSETLTWKRKSNVLMTKHFKSFVRNCVHFPRRDVRLNLPTPIWLRLCSRVSQLVVWSCQGFFFQAATDRFCRQWWLAATSTHTSTSFEQRHIHTCVWTCASVNTLGHTPSGDAINFYIALRSSVLDFSKLEAQHNAEFRNLPTFHPKFPPEAYNFFRRSWSLPLVFLPTFRTRVISIANGNAFFWRLFKAGNVLRATERPLQTSAEKRRATVCETAFFQWKVMKVFKRVDTC